VPTATADGTLAPMTTLGGGEGQPHEEQSKVNPIQAVGDKTFILQNGVWTDTTFTPDTMQTQKVTFLSDEYFALLDGKPEIAQFLAIGDHVIVVLDGTAYEVVPEA